MCFFCALWERQAEFKNHLKSDLQVFHQGHSRLNENFLFLFLFISKMGCRLSWSTCYYSLNMSFVCCQHTNSQNCTKPCAHKTTWGSPCWDRGHEWLSLRTRDPSLSHGRCGLGQFCVLWKGYILKSHLVKKNHCDAF
jgi:hypothetical protein